MSERDTSAKSGGSTERKLNLPDTPIGNEIRSNLYGFGIGWTATHIGDILKLTPAKGPSKDTVSKTDWLNSEKEK